jgi:hypothetical protein
LRIFKRSIAPLAARVGLAADDGKRIRTLMMDYSRKGDVGAQRTFAKLRHHFYPATVERLQKGILWSWLDPRGAMLADPTEPGETQDAILVRYGLAWVVRKREVVGYEEFTLEAPDHALARMLQRSPGTDLKVALHQAHHAIFQAFSTGRESACGATDASISPLWSGPADLRGVAGQHAERIGLCVLSGPHVDIRRYGAA